MGIVRTATTVTRPSLQNTAVVAAATTGVLCMSLDRAAVYGGYGGNVLHRSTNSGSTMTALYTFTGSRTIMAAMILSNGEMLVSFKTGGGPAELFRSTGFAANPATATWALVLTATASSSSEIRHWGLHEQSEGPNGQVAVIEYGNKGGDRATWATRVWRSNDYGLTWTVALNLTDRYPDQTNMHGHALTYDKWWNRWWITFGDNHPIAEPGVAGDGSGLMTILYSDDGMATWTRLKKPADQIASMSHQTVTVLALESCVIFSPDLAQTTFWRIERKGYRVASDLHATFLRGGTGAVLLGQGSTPPAAPGMPAFMTATSWSANGYDTVMATLDGVEFFEVDSRVRTNSASGTAKVVGPTTGGKVVIGSDYSGTMQNLVSDLVWETR